MRSTALPMAMVVAIAACSNDPGPTDPGRTAPPPANLVVQYEGSESGLAGLVEVKVEFRRTSSDDAAIYAGETLVQLMVDGESVAAPDPARFRVNGAETEVAGFPDADEIEVWTGLGGDQDWITARRTR